MKLNMNKFSGKSNKLQHFLVFDTIFGTENSSLIKIKEKINAHMGINARVWVLFLRKMTNFIIHFIKMSKHFNIYNQRYFPRSFYLIFNS